MVIVSAPPVLTTLVDLVGLLAGFVAAFWPVLVALAVVYLGACLIWPYEPCPRCGGRAPRSPSGRYWRDCRRCGGRGRRLRWGARIVRSLAAGARR